MGRTISGAIIGFITIAGIFLFGIVAMGVRVNGSMPGFGILLACMSILAATFGLLVAAMGKTEEQSRGAPGVGSWHSVLLDGAQTPMPIPSAWLAVVVL